MTQYAEQSAGIQCLYLNEVITPTLCYSAQGKHCVGCTATTRGCLGCRDVGGIVDAQRGLCQRCLDKQAPPDAETPRPTNGNRAPTLTSPTIGGGKPAGRALLPEHAERWQHMCGSETDARRVLALAMQGKLEVGDRIRTKSVLGILLTSGVPSPKEANVLLERLQTLKVLQRVNDHEVVIPLPRDTQDALETDADVSAEDTRIVPATPSIPPPATVAPPPIETAPDSMSRMARDWETSPLFARTEEIISILVAAGTPTPKGEVEVEDPILVLETQVDRYRSADWRRLFVWLKSQKRAQYQRGRLYFPKTAAGTVHPPRERTDTPTPAVATKPVVPAPLVVAEQERLPVQPEPVLAPRTPTTPPSAVVVPAPPPDTQAAELPLPEPEVLEQGAEESIRLRLAEEEIAGLNGALLLTHQRVLELTTRLAKLEAAPQPTLAQPPELVGKTGGFVEVDGQLFGNVSYLAQHFGVDWKKMRDFLEAEQVPYRAGRTATNRPAKFYRVHDVVIARKILALAHQLAAIPTPNPDLRLAPVYKDGKDMWLNQAMVELEICRSGQTLAVICGHRSVRRITKHDHLNRPVTYYNRADIRKVAAKKG